MYVSKNTFRILFFSLVGAKGNSSVQTSESVTVMQAEKPIVPNDIVPAQGAIVNQKGQVVLTRYATSNGSDSLRDSSASRTLTQSNCSDRALLSGEANRASKNRTSNGYVFSANYLVGFN